MAKVNIGEMPCRTCSRTVIVKENEKKTLSYRCDYCDSAPYEREGTMAAKIWREVIRPISYHPPMASAPAAPIRPSAPAPVVPTSAPAPAPVPKPEPDKESSLPWV